MTALYERAVGGVSCERTLTRRSRMDKRENMPFDESAKLADEHDNMSAENKPQSGLIIGRNAVTEALRADRLLDRLYVQRGAKGSLVPLVAKARERGISVKEVDGKKLDFMCAHGNHQGIIASAAVKEYSTLEESFELAEKREEKPFFIICDELEDPHNLGAIIRTAECSGAHGVIVPERRSVGLSYSVGKASAGAIEHMPIIRVRNIADTIDELKEKGLWIYGADMSGQAWCETDYTGAVALVIGSEGKGIGKRVKEKCDFVVSLPMKGQIDSLNASVAAGVICYEISRQRSGLKAINP